jgi:hypothetical protein
MHNVFQCSVQDKEAVHVFLSLLEEHTFITNALFLHEALLGFGISILISVL